jgi:hypothetical protein
MEKTRSLTDRDFTDLWEQHSLFYGAGWNPL